MKNFRDYLDQEAIDQSLQAVLHDLLEGFLDIFSLLQKEQGGYWGTENSFGEQQLKVDVRSDEILIGKLQKNNNVATLASEELMEPIRLAHDGGRYSVFFDPLDGSSIFDVNFSVGTIVGVYDHPEILGKTLEGQSAALFALYGRQLVVVITLKEKVYHFQYVVEEALGEDVFERFHFLGELTLREQGKYFSPGNLRAAKEVPAYLKLMEYLALHDYVLRYSGGMVPDVYQILKKGGGVFLYPGSVSEPMGKLRLLYEVGPMALIFERAGGKAVRNKERVLALSLEEYHQRVPVILGSKLEVEMVQKFFL